MIEKHVFIKKIAEKCRNDDLAVFLGAGMSVDAGLPSWKALFSPLADELGIDIDKTSYQIYDISQFYANTFGKKELYIKVGKEINRILESSNALEQLALLQSNSFWTSNFDQVLENNLSKFGKIINVISRESDLTSCDLNKYVKTYPISKCCSFQKAKVYFFAEQNDLNEIVERYIYDIVHKLSYTESENAYVWVNKIIDFSGGRNYAIRLIHPNLLEEEGKYLSTDMQDIEGNRPYDTELKIIEVQKGDKLIEEDIVRYQDIYGRVSK